MGSAKTAPVHSYHPIYARMLSALLLEKGIDPLPLLRAAGLDVLQIGPASLGVSHAALCELALRAQQQCAEPTLALQLGARIKSHAHGQFSTALLSSASLGEALDTLCRLSSLRVSAFIFSLQPLVTEVRMTVREIAPLGEARAFLLEAIGVMLVELLQPLLGPAIARVTLEMPFAAPAWLSAYPQYLPCAVSFGAAHVTLRIPTPLLTLPSPLADAHAHSTAVRQCEADLLQQPLGETCLRVCAYLRRQPGVFPGLAAVARELCLSERTLGRLLQFEGSSFRLLLEQVRHQEAQLALRESRATVEQIADRLGYSDPSNFIRAFRRWCGLTPQQYRAACLVGVRN